MNLRLSVLDLTIPLNDTITIEMGLFKSLKEKTGRHDSDSHQSQFQSPEFATGSSSSTAGQSGFEHLSTANEKRRLFGGLGSQHNVGTNAAQQQSFEPPPGPPPGHKRQNVSALSFPNISVCIV